jgi:hypothetical protein
MDQSSDGGCKANCFRFFAVVKASARGDQKINLFGKSLM